MRPIFRNKELSPAQQKIVEHIRHYWDRHGYGPINDEIVEATGFHRTTVANAFPLLFAKGVLVCERVKSGRRKLRTTRVKDDSSVNGS